MSKFDINELKEKKNQREKELLKLMSEYPYIWRRCSAYYNADRR